MEHRLGLALGKDLRQVRAMPYPEFASWRLFYALEPWGWGNEEYSLGSILAMLYNLNRGKKKAKSPKDFMRNMSEEIIKGLLKPSIFDMDPEKLKDLIRKDFGVDKPSRKAPKKPGARIRKDEGAS